MTKREIILTILEHGAEVTSKLMYLYGTTSVRENARRLGHLMGGDEKRKRFDWVASFEEMQNFYSTLTQLRVQGFIKKQTQQGGTSWKILSKGIKKVREMRSKTSFAEQFSQYAAIQDDVEKVIVFDVPERDRKKRAWLRSALFSMGFSLLQKSVWRGKKRIPKEFLFELQRRKMLRHVHIFAVSKLGTLQNIDSKK